MDAFSSLEDFFSRFTSIEFQKGDLLIRALENPPGIYYLRSGYVRLYSITETDNELTLNIFKPGSFFPMIWALGNLDNTFFFEALSPVSAWRAPKDQVVKFLRNQPTVFFDLTRRLTVGFNGLINHLGYLLSNNAQSKVISVLLMLARRFGTPASEGQVVIKLHLTHQDIAHLAYLARETASIELKKLERQGLISQSRRLWVVNNLPQLEHLILSSSILYRDSSPPVT
jgi:CRP-like cAMP-binding protein